MRKDRPTRIASRSPARTRRYTVCFETRKIVAVSKMVRNRALFGGEALPVTMLLEVRTDVKMQHTGRIRTDEDNAEAVRCQLRDK
jgi:hypothetical protein